jgi:hypothetical protein
MKKLLLIICLSGLFVASIAADEEGESLARLYQRMPEIKQKYIIMQDIVRLNDTSLEPFLVSSLEELVYGELSHYRSATNTYDDWESLTRIIIGELGDIKARTAAPVIWDVVITAEVPLLKAEGLVALGSLRSVEYAKVIAIILRDLNFNTRDDKTAAEIEAYGAVTALDKMKSNEGFESLFYAAIGWYPDRITNYAEEALMSISDDPAPMLVEVLVGAQDYADKRKALEFALKSSSPVSGKTLAAATALEEGLKYGESNYNRIRELANLRIDAISALITLNDATPETPDLLDKAIEEGELDEKLIAIQALGSDGGDVATEILARRTYEFNERQSSGLALDQDEQILVRQLIFALGESGNAIGIKPLKELSVAGYTPAILRLADEAMAKIEGN